MGTILRPILVLAVKPASRLALALALIRTNAGASMNEGFVVEQAVVVALTVDMAAAAVVALPVVARIVTVEQPAAVGQEQSRYVDQ